MSKLYDSNLKLNSNMIDPFHKQQLEKAYELLLNDNNLSEIENLIHDYLSGLVEKDNQRKAELAVKIRTAEHVIEKIQQYVAYAEHKASPKMRLTRKEFDYSMSLLDLDEGNKVMEWIKDNGGFESVLAPEWGNG